MIVAQQQNEYEELESFEETEGNSQIQKAGRNSTKIKNKILVTLFFASIGAYTLCQQVNIAKVQNSIYDSQQKLKECQADNQKLNVDIVKSTNLETIETKAQEKYGMQVAGPDDYVRVTLKPSVENGQAHKKAKAGNRIVDKVLKFFK